MRLITNSIPLGANVHKNILPLARIIIALAAVSFLIYALAGISGKEWIIWKSTLNLSTVNLLILTIVVLLMPFNWGIEALKWKLLIAKVEAQTWQKSVFAILYGISLGMITPKRTGEFAGRVYWLQPGNRLPGLLLNTAGSLSQLFITLVAGVVAATAMISQLQLQYIHVAPGMASPSWFLRAGILGGVTIGVLFFLLPVIARSTKFKRNTIRGKISRSLNIFSLLTPNDLLTQMGLSFLRYSIFCIQFYLLLKLFGLQIPFFTAISLIAIIYLFMTLVPLSAIWELGVRGSIAVLVFSLYFTPSQSIVFEMPVLAATTLLWAINLAMPAMAGGVLGLSTEIRSTKNKE